MVVLTKIYTRTGDDGTTALGTGARVPKDHLRISAYGTVDELNASLGQAVLAAPDTPADYAQIRAGLTRIQNDLFDLGADLCVPDTGEELPYEPLRMSAEQTAWLEAEIDRMNAELKPLTSFVLPGGTPAAAALHVSRTICRRAERLVAALAAIPEEHVSEAALSYINRLSDYLFVASRYLNDKGAGDVLWQPGANR
ncbi:MAG: cob(I)yrinic acid a,c-diamide adenosyltransferase [Dichotomicrobium sp.]